MGLCFWKWGRFPHEFEECSEREKHIILGMAQFYAEEEEKAMNKK